MGAGIAEVSARSGLDVVVVESTPEAVTGAVERLRRSLERAADKGKVESVDALMDRIRVVADLTELSDRNMVIEAIAEDERAKVDLLRSLDQIVEDSEAILASNTSSIPIMKLGVATSRPHQVLGIHFFDPVRCSSWSSSYPACSPRAR